MKVEIQSVQSGLVDSHQHPQGSLSSYLLAFWFSVALTAVAFWLVVGGVLGDKQVTALAIIGLAATQIVVHMVYFLHMNTHSEGGWTMMALIFTVIMVVIALTGSLWVMHH
ncbi:MAG TPA: cytochrome o ubiquinol oxidase subunit IV, partial [Ktedonobacterales bacterium]|nr:cytochrome o ubiquinol oxidase subunit IV [Ktedonobacterales bacterium]